MSGKTANYYELLEIRPDASNMDIINAYRQAKLTFKADSMATYSLFDEEELRQMQEQIEQAYATLSNIEKRRVYDRQLGLSREEGASGRETADTVQDNVVTLDGGAERPAGIRYRMAVATVFTGRLLREVREFRGIELAAIAEHTKISRQYLQAIEDEDEKHLPEPAYLKGYLKQYAAEIGLDPERVVGRYPPLQRGD